MPLDRGVVVVDTVSMTRLAILSLVIGLGVGCAPLSLSVRGDTGAAKPAVVRTYVEPYTEAAELELRTQAAGNATVYYQDKPYFAKRSTLDGLYERARKEMTGELMPLASAQNDTGVVRVVRTTVTKNSVMTDDTTLQILIAVLPCAFLCPAGLLYPMFVPSEHTERLEALVQVFEFDGASLAERLVVVPGARDPFFNADGLRPVHLHSIDLTLEMKRGVFTTVADTALLDGVAGPLFREVAAAAGAKATTSVAPVAPPATL